MLSWQCKEVQGITLIQAFLRCSQSEEEEEEETVGKTNSSHSESKASWIIMRGPV